MSKQTYLVTVVYPTPTYHYTIKADSEQHAIDQVKSGRGKPVEMQTESEDRSQPEYYAEVTEDE